MAIEIKTTGLPREPTLKPIRPSSDGQKLIEFKGAARMTTGSMATQETIQDSRITNWLIVTSGKLATPAAIKQVRPD